MNRKLHINNFVHFKLSSKHAKIFGIEYENVSNYIFKTFNMSSFQHHVKKLCIHNLVTFHFEFRNFEDTS
jgi:hypothetical protein